MKALRSIVSILTGLMLVAGLLAIQPAAPAVAQTGEGNQLYVAKWSEPVTLTNVTGRPSVVFDGTYYHLWYNTSSTALYHTASTNPAEFTEGTLTTFPEDNTPIEVASPAVFMEGNTFYMVVYGATDQVFNWYSSPDGNNWTNKGLAFNAAGMDDLGKIDAPFVFKDGGTYRLYFQKKSVDGSKYRIHAAVTENLETPFTLVKTDPVLTEGETGWDDYRIMHPWVVKSGDQYFMWYVGYSKTDTTQKLGLATSVDGTNWTKSPANPIIATRAAEPVVIFVDGTWHLWYLGPTPANNIIYISATGPFEFQDIQAAINAAGEGGTIQVAPGTYTEMTVPGGIVIEKPHLNILLKDGTVIENNSPCFVVNADYTRIRAESKLGAQCIPTLDSNGIDVKAGVIDLIIEGIDFAGTNGTDGIHFAGDITDLIIADNWFHGFASDGIEFTNAPAGEVQIQGNLFQDNTGLGINAGDHAVNAEYNSWGHVDGAQTGDGASTNIDTDPWTHVDLSVKSAGTSPEWDSLTSQVVDTLANVSGRPTVLKDGSTYHLWYGTSDDTLYHTTSTNPAEFIEGTLTTFTGVTPIEVASPAVFKEDSTFYMVAYGATDSKSFNWYSSTDGNNWTNKGLAFDAAGMGDISKIDAPFVFKDGETYRLYFQKKNTAGSQYHIHAAETNSPGSSFALVNSGNPVLSPTPGTWDGAYVMHPWVVKDEDKYFMWYSAHPGTNQQIGLATSSDGIAWEKSSANPVIGPLGEPAVINDNGIWRIWYLGTGKAIKYQTALSPLDLRQTIAYQVKANMVNVNSADFILNYPSDLLSIASIVPGPYLDSVIINSTTPGQIHYYGYRTTTPTPVTDEILYTVIFYTKSQGTGGLNLSLSGSTAGFGMPGAGSSSNVYLPTGGFVNGNVTIIDLPSMTTDFGKDYYLVGEGRDFNVTVNNHYTAYPQAVLKVTVPAGEAGIGDTVLNLAASETESVNFTFTPASAGEKTLGFDLYDAANGHLLYSIADTVKVYDQPEISSTDLVGPYLVGVQQQFQVTTTNPATGANYAQVLYNYTIPTAVLTDIASFQYQDGETWRDMPLEQSGDDLVGYFGPSTGFPMVSGFSATTNFRVTFNTAKDYTFVLTLNDLDADKLELARFEAIAVVLDNLNITGTVSMQGRTVTSGVPMTLTALLVPYGPYQATSFDQISNNISFSSVAAGGYLITTNQPRYLNLTADLNITKVFSSEAFTINRLELKGGNAKWTDNLIDLSDASVITTVYGQTGDMDADVNFDGKVNILDLALVGGNYNLTSATAYASWTP